MDGSKAFRTLYVTGGARSGKSTYALQRAMMFEKRIFVATAEAFDEEMARRIQKHREERKDDFAVTIEEPLELPSALCAADGVADVILVDCLTVWLGNLFHRVGDKDEIAARIDALLEALQTVRTPVIAVSNELGMGIVPQTAMGRAFRDAAGFLNQKTARHADEAVLMVSGLPVHLK